MYYLPVNLKYINFCKDSFPMYHQTGVNHTLGDTLDVTDQEDINATVDIIWNVSKFFIIDPDCWFDGDPEFTLHDSNDINTIYDSINVSYTIKTNMPQDRISVRFILHPAYDKSHPAYPMLYRLRKQKEYIITNSESITDFINVSLPDHFPSSEYIAKIYLCNSTGDVSLDAIKSINIPLTGAEMIDRIKDSMDINILEELLPRVNQIYEETRINIIDWLWKLHDCRKVRNLLIDFLGYNVFYNSSHVYSSFDLAPANDPPTTPIITEYPTQVEPWDLYRFKSKTTDPDGDDIRFKWHWGGLSYSTWSIQKYQDNEEHKKWHFWLPPVESGNFKVKVKACDVPLNPNYHSEWATATISMEEGCAYENILENTFNPHSNPNYNIIIVNNDNDFEGETYGIEITRDTNYSYNFSDGTIIYGQNVNHTYTTTNTYNITYTVINETTTYNYTEVFKVVNTSAGFNISNLGAQPNQNITFTNVSQSIRNIENHTWNFGDGNISYAENPSHNYPSEGSYNVTLTIRDSNNEESTAYLVVHIETKPPNIIDAPFEPNSPYLGSNVTLYAEVFDNQSEIQSVNVNITQPDGTTCNYTMIESPNSTYDYRYVFSDTELAGWYYYTIWVKDHANNINYTAGHVFNISQAFGYTTEGNQQKNIHNNITGSNFTIQVNGTAESITAFIQTNGTPTPKTRCMIYRINDSILMGTTEEKIVNTDANGSWIEYNFTGTQPDLVRDTEYVLSIWSNATANLSYDNTTDLAGRFTNDYTYGSSPNPINWTDNETRVYSIYCSYSTLPEITDVTLTPDSVGFGYNVTVSCNVEDNAAGIDNISINITYPNEKTGNFTMNNTSGDTYQYVFSDTWLTGQYNISIWAIDEFGGVSSSIGHSFNVSVNATITVCTIKDSYGNNETINLTDPPGQIPTIGYELMDNNQVLHIWNRNDHYYFNTSSGIQLTNHKDQYWSHNILMLGYYNNNQWNLIYRTDELSGFTNNIETDNQTYINITLWKDLTYQSYDFRLAIRYHLGVNDNELTIIPYIKNLGAHIPYTMGFAWEIQDIQIAMTETDDHLEINGSSYQLNQPMNQTFSNMTQPIYGWNTTTNQTYIKDYTPIPYFHIKEYFPNGRSESLYLRWNHTLTYQVNVQSQEGQYNAPITLGIKIGTLQPNQEKQTTLYWHDASQTTYYFNSYDKTEQWANSPGDMTDGSIETHAYASSGDIQLLDDNTYEENTGNILKVELRTRGYCYGGQRDITLRPVFNGSTDGSNYTFEPSSTGSWSSWYDITTDANAPSNWTWTDISNLECDVEAESGYMFGTSYCAKVELRVTYTDTPPETTIYYFDRNDETEIWTEAPEYMTDGDSETFAYTDTKTDVELLISNTCTVEDTEEVYKVEFRVRGYHGENYGNISLRPVFNGTTDGSEYLFFTPLEEPAAWSNWFDITNDANAPTNWTWSDVTNLDCDVIATENASGDSSIDVFCSKIEIRVTYVPTNNPPGISNPIPANNSIGVSLTPQISITVSDAEGDSMNITWSSNSSGTWHVFGTNNSVANGTYYQTFSNATVNGQWWYWRINVSDGENYTLGPIYRFYTGNQSKIKNTGTTAFKGYLLIQVHYYNTSSSNWTVVDDTVNETTPRVLTNYCSQSGGDELGLDTIFNGLVTTNDFSSYGNGTYRIYAAFRDIYGDVLEINGGTKLEATYEYTIQFS
jgi:hypothetical protein